MSFRTGRVITQHIPDPGMQMVRYYGWYSNKARGQHGKNAQPATPDPAAVIDTDDEDTPRTASCAACAGRF